MGREDRAKLAELARRARLKIAIDGPAGAGKSTVGKGLAAILNSPLLDTGLMYRTVTRRAHEESIDPSDEAGVARIAENLSFYLDQSGADWILSEHGTPLSHEMLHSPVIDRDVSAVSAHPAVRREMVRQQREMAGGNGIVMLGRDIGTVVLPEAPVKLFVTASPEVRGRRRHLQRASEVHDETDTLRDIRARDSWDQSRPVSPLKAADGAVVIDTSSKTAQESLEQALSAVSQALDKTTALNG